MFQFSAMDFMSLFNLKFKIKYIYEKLISIIYVIQFNFDSLTRRNFGVENFVDWANA